MEAWGQKEPKGAIPPKSLLIHTNIHTKNIPLKSLIHNVIINKVSQTIPPNAFSLFSLNILQYEPTFAKQ